MTGLYSPCDMHRIGASTDNANDLEHLHPNPQLTNNKHAEAIPQILEGCSPTTDVKSNQHTDGMTILPSDRAASVDVATTSLSEGSIDGKISVGIAEEGGDIDIYLLSELVSLDVSKASDISWEDLRAENAQERWYELLEEWQSSIMDDSLLALPISEIAQLILERKTNAQRAAETVEAVDLPNPLWNQG